MRRIVTALLLPLAACDCGGEGRLGHAESNLTYSPKSLDLGDVAVGTTRKLAVTFTNQGGAVVKIGPATVDAEPFAVDGVAAATLSTAQSARINVAFSPVAEGAFS